MKHETSENLSERSCFLRCGACVGTRFAFPDRPGCDKALAIRPVVLYSTYCALESPLPHSIDAHNHRSREASSSPNSLSSSALGAYWQGPDRAEDVKEASTPSTSRRAYEKHRMRQTTAQLSRIHFHFSNNTASPDVP